MLTVAQMFPRSQPLLLLNPWESAVEVSLTALCVSCHRIWSKWKWCCNMKIHFHVTTSFSRGTSFVKLIWINFQWMLRVLLRCFPLGTWSWRFHSCIKNQMQIFLLFLNMFIIVVNNMYYMLWIIGVNLVNFWYSKDRELKLRNFPLLAVIGNKL